MAKTILRFDSSEDFDFLLVGIVCQHKDYRLCHELNKTLQLELVRDNDYEIFTSRRLNAAAFSFFLYENGDGDCYYLISNRGQHALLIPEQKQIDYFLMIRENFVRINLAELIGTVKTIPIVLGAYAVEAKALKSRSHLLF